MASLIRAVYHKGLKILAGPALQQLQPLFSSKNSKFCSLLETYGFSPILVNCPELMFEKHVGKAKVKGIGIATGLWLGLLKRGFSSGSLICPKGEEIMRKAGVNPVFISNKSSVFDTAPVAQYSIPINRHESGKIVVYSALTGNYDTPHDLLYKNPDVAYLLFTNNRELTSHTWEVIYVDSPLNDKDLSRDIKINPHKYLDKQYSASIYIDANASVYGDISQLCGYLDESVSFAVTKHSARNCVKDEIEACIKYKGVDPDEAREQYDRYLRQGFTDTIGLAECTILIRRHFDEAICKLMEMWWDEYRKGIKRDQISLPYCLEKSGFNNFRIVDGNVFRNQFCIAGGHNPVR